LDIIGKISGYLLEDFCKKNEVSPTLRKTIKEGKLEAKTGSGFYRWSTDSLHKINQIREDNLIEWLKKDKQGYLNWEEDMVHLVYCDDKEKVLEKILAGEKTMIVRGAAGRKIPHSRVSNGETLYFMKKGMAKISAMAKVINVQNYVKLTEEEILRTLQENQDKLNLTDKQKTRWRKKCLCLVEFAEVKEILPLTFDHQSNMDDWLIIEKIEDVVVGTSIPYNYDNSKF